MEKTIASITKPKDEELKERLSAAREKLATLQIKVKEASFGNHFYTDISSGFRRMDSSRSWMAAGWKKS